MPFFVCEAILANLQGVVNLKLTACPYLHSCFLGFALLHLLVQQESALDFHERQMPCNPHRSCAQLFHHGQLKAGQFPAMPENCL
jgi:hypothetical protein